MKDTREVFSCWIGEQEKEIRNVKPSTTVKGKTSLLCLAKCEMDGQTI